LASGQTAGAMVGHTIVRSLVLIVLGMIVVAVHPRQWIWGFTDTLTQIGLGYPILFAVALRRKREWYWVIAGILIGYWLFFALTPMPRTDFDYAAAAVPPEWLSVHGLSGFYAHWQKNSNIAGDFDRWLLNLFPRREPYIGDMTGLTTLNFIPSVATMMLGLFACGVLTSARGHLAKLGRLVSVGIVLFLSGWFLGWAGICPVVKAIWTPSWVLLSGGLCFLFLAGFHAVVDVGGARRLAFPLIVIGMNSIVAYLMAHFYPALAFNSLRRVAGDRPFRIVGDVYDPVIYGAAILLMYWAVLYALYRQRIFVRI
jgi:heparan-alpha-glucosaminide N-acetyltransferase